MGIFIYTNTRKVFFWKTWLLAVVVVFTTGMAHRIIAAHLELTVKESIELAAPLRTFPMEIDGWIGRDMMIPEYIQRIAGNDDFLYRSYRHKLTGQSVNIYIAYSGQPRTMLGHRPTVCYVAGGWVHDSTIESGFLSQSGKKRPSLIHRFHRASPEYKDVVVLNFYIINGQITNSESGFSAVRWRSPNIAGDPARYVVQVQISSVLENTVLTAGEDMVPLIMSFFPDETEGNAVR